MSGTPQRSAISLSSGMDWGAHAPSRHEWLDGDLARLVFLMHVFSEGAENHTRGRVCSPRGKFRRAKECAEFFGWAPRETEAPSNSLCEVLCEVLRLRVSILQNLTSRLRHLRGIFFETAEEEQCGGDADAGVGDIEGRPPAAARWNEFVVEGDLDGYEVDDIAL